MGYGQNTIFWRWQMAKDKSLLQQIKDARSGGYFDNFNDAFKKHRHKKQIARNSISQGVEIVYTKGAMRRVISKVSKSMALLLIESGDAMFSKDQMLINKASEIKDLR